MLRSRSWMSAQGLAEHFSVSLRTIYRDVAELQSHGVTIRSTVGRDGGYQLDDESPFPRVLLASGDALTMFLMSGGLESDKRIAGPLSERMAELAEHAGPEAVENLRAAAQRIFFDTSEWYWRDEGTTLLPVIREALFQANCLELTFELRPDVIQECRLLDPLGLVWKGGEWYLVARTREDGIFRCRLARVASARLTDAAFIYPPDFNLRQWWSNELESFGKGDIAVRLRVRPEAQDDFRRLAIKGSTTMQNDGSDVIFTLFVDRWEWIVPLVLSHAPYVIVEGPVEVRKAVTSALQESLASHQAITAIPTKLRACHPMCDDDSKRRATRGRGASRGFSK